MWYLAKRFASTPGGRAFSREKGPPGAVRMITKPKMIITSRVGIKLKNRFNTNRPIKASSPKY
jgi:hypothetical protein